MNNNPKFAASQWYGPEDISKHDILSIPEKRKWVPILAALKEYQTIYIGYFVDYGYGIELRILGFNKNKIPDLEKWAIINY